MPEIFSCQFYAFSLHKNAWIKVKSTGEMSDVSCTTNIKDFVLLVLSPVRLGKSQMVTTKLYTRARHEKNFSTEMGSHKYLLITAAFGRELVEVIKLYIKLVSHARKTCISVIDTAVCSVSALWCMEQILMSLLSFNHSLVKIVTERNRNSARIKTEL